MRHTDDQLVVITGASSGIGAATAAAFAAAGNPLLLLARNAAAMEALGLPNAMICPVDVTDTASVAEAISAAEARYGPVDLLVNNAGVMPLSTVVDQPPADIERMFTINCVAPMLLAQLVLPGMIERSHGTIINVGSIAGKQLYGNHVAYCGTKFALHAMTEGLRRELAPAGIRVMLVAPGMTDTNLLSNTPAGTTLSDYMAYKTSIDGGLQPEDIAQAIVHAYQLPQHVCTREIVLAPSLQDA